MSESTQSTIINGYNMSKYIAASQQIKFSMGWPIAYITQDASEIHSQTQCKAKYNYFNGVLNELQCEKTYRLTCALNKDSDQPALTRNLIRVFIVRMKKLCIHGYTKSAQ